MPSGATVTLLGLVSATGAVAACATVAGFLGRLSWWLELASHFRLQYFATLLATALVLAFARRFRSAAVYGVFAAVNLLLIVPLYQETGEPPVPPSAPRFRAMLANVFTTNHDHDAVLSAIKKYDPDVMVLQEMNDRWIRQLEHLSREYPYSIHEPREDNFGIGLYSKRALEDGEIIYLGQATVPSVFGFLPVDGERVAILGTHPLPPASRLGAALRDDQLERIASFAASVEPPLLVLGDLNTSPWSYRFQELLENSGLRDSLLGYGLQVTWPATIWPMLIPLDHCLYSEGLRILAREVGPFVGSDHYPVIVDVALAASRFDRHR